MIMLLRTLMMPFSVMSYLLGLTSVKFKDYVVGSLVVTFHIAFFLYLGTQIPYLEFDDSGDDTHKQQ